MNKFTISEIPESDDLLPVLFKIFIGDKGKYYLHKSKKLKEGAERFLDDVYRGIRSKTCPEYYSEVVKYCNKFPAIHTASIEVVLNEEPAKILRKEKALFIAMKKDPDSLNNIELGAYAPEWMIKSAQQDRCQDCLKSGIVNGRKRAFKFCPNCGRLNK